jgi:hypothetical protein
MKILEPDKKEKVNELDESLGSLDIRSRVEVIGNYFIRLGVRTVDPEVIPKNLRELWLMILDDREKNGETLGAALAHQGLFILLWLEENEE